MLKKRDGCGLTNINYSRKFQKNYEDGQKYKNKKLPSVGEAVTLKTMQGKRQGTVTYVHPKGNYYVVSFRYGRGGEFRESFTA